MVCANVRSASAGAIHRAALELQPTRAGGCVPTVDAIAERAGVSPRTFFNYPDQG